MLFLGIDQHARQLTVSLRDQSGDVVLARQVSTQPEKVLEFFDQLTRRCAQREEQFIRDAAASPESRESTGRAARQLSVEVPMSWIRT